MATKNYKNNDNFSLNETPKTDYEGLDSDNNSDCKNSIIDDYFDYENSLRPYNKKIMHPRKMRFHGKKYILDSGFRFSALIKIFFIVWCTILTIAFSDLLSDTIKAIDKLETLHLEYQTQIENAKQNPNLIIEGEVTKVYQAKSGWYYYYKFTASDGTVVKDNLSQKTYSSRALAPAEGDIIKLATKSLETNKDSVVIPMDYETFTLESDITYRSDKIGIVFSIVLIVINGVAVCLLLFFLVRGYVKFIKKQDELDIQGVPTDYCEHCGKRIRPDDIRCGFCDTLTEFGKFKKNNH